MQVSRGPGPRLALHGELWPSAGRHSSKRECGGFGQRGHVANSGPALSLWRACCSDLRGPGGGRAQQGSHSSRPAGRWWLQRGRALRRDSQTAGRASRRERERRELTTTKAGPARSGASTHNGDSGGGAGGRGTRESGVGASSWGSLSVRPLGVGFKDPAARPRLETGLGAGARP